jgi:predicted adenylyl cyclase CyaB
MRELELKAVVPDLEACRARLRAEGAEPREAGALRDWRFDTADFALRAADVVLRVREFSGTPASRASIDWKGAAKFDSGYKEREETSLGIADATAAVALLQRLGFQISYAIEREIEVYDLHGASVRFERYARMDTLVEVEGAPEAIERAIVALGIPRAAFNTGRLSDFAREFEARTGRRAAVSLAEASQPDTFDRADV